MLEGVGGVFTFRIENGHGYGQFVIRHVMVADDKVYAKGFGICNFFDCLDAAIEHNDECYTAFCCVVHCLDTDTITFLITVRNVVFNVGIELLQELVH